MDAQQFLAEFAHVVDAPGGIGKLRELVIQLAISGRLVARIKSEATSSQVIEMAVNLRRAYEEEFDLRATRMQPPLDSRPFPIPEHWQWTRLEQLCLYIQRGKGPKYVEKSLTHVISQKCVQWSGFDLSSARFVADDSSSSYGKERFLCAGDLLWNSTGTGTAGRVAIYQPTEKITAVADSHVTVVRLANCSPRYLWCVIASPWVQSRMEPSHSDSLVSGTTQQVELNASTARALPIPLPPFEEQSRIVAKVDELMALCDKLEEQQRDRRKLQNDLRQSTLQAVANAISPHELQATWVRLSENLGQLFHAPEDVVSLRFLLLNLAMRGLLVSQSDLDTPAELLLQEIDFERRQLIATKKLKASAVIPLPPEGELPYSLPKGWVWARVIDLVDVGTGATPAKSEPSYYGGRTPWYTSAATNEKFARKPEASITDKALSETNCKVFPAGSLIVALYGQGKTRGQISEITVAGATNQALAALVFLKSSLKSKRFVKYYFEKIYDEIRLQAEGGPQPNLSVGKIKETLVPVPPIEEQERIVARLDELMFLGNQLEQKLRDSRKLAKRLAVSVVASLTGIAIELEEDPMKAPQTELIAPLSLGVVPDIKTQAPLATILARHNGEMGAKDLWQRFGGEIDAFYAQLKAEVAHGWVLEPVLAEMREKPANTGSA